MAEAEAKGLTVCASSGLAADIFVRKNYPNAKIVGVEGVTLMYENLFTDKCDLVVDSVSSFEARKLDATLNPFCSLEWVGRALQTSTAGPANIVDTGDYCTSLVGHIFEYYLKAMESDGFNERAHQRYIDHVTTHTCPEKDVTSISNDDSDTLTMVDMGGVFIVHGVFCVVGLLVSLTQRWCRNRSTRGGSGSSRSSRSHENVEVDASEDQSEDNEVKILSAHPLGSGAY